MRLSRNRHSLWPFALMSAAYFGHIGFFNPFLPLWLKDMGLGLVAISALTAMQAATRLVAPFGWGWLSDHLGQRERLLRWCTLLALLAALLLMWPWPLWGTTLVLLVLFVHTSALMPMTEAAVAQRVSQDGQFDAHRYGRARLWASVGFLVSVLAAGYWFERMGTHHFPLLGALTLGLVLVTALLLPRSPRKPPHPVGAKTPPARMRDWLGKPLTRWFLISVVAQVLAHMGIYQFFSLYIDSLGHARSNVGMLWAVAVLAEIAWFFFQARWFSRLSLSGWLRLSAAVVLLRMLLTAAAGEYLWVLWLAQLLHAVTFGAHHTACMAWLAQTVPTPLQGRAQALYSVLAYGLTGLLGGLLGGLLSEHLGLRAVFWACTAVALLALLAAHRLQGLLHPPRPKESSR